MKKLFIVANWKSNKTQVEVIEWLWEFQISNFTLRQAQGKALRLRSEQEYPISNEIVVCPPFTLLSYIKSSITDNKLSIKLGAQDISCFKEGSYTGEINGKQIKEFADYVIIGHSERRKYFGETNEVINEKVESAIEHGLIPILCVSNLDQINDYPFKVDPLKMIIAYEPLFAIGSGRPDTPENANNIAQKIKSELNNVPVLYGGSVTSENARNFAQSENINGLLIGKASLNPLEFAKIAKLA